MIPIEIDFQNGLLRNWIVTNNINGDVLLIDAPDVYNYSSFNDGDVVTVTFTAEDDDECSFDRVETIDCPESPVIFPPVTTTEIGVRGDIGIDFGYQNHIFYDSNGVEVERFTRSEIDTETNGESFWTPTSNDSLGVSGIAKLQSRTNKASCWVGSESGVQPNNIFNPKVGFNFEFNVGALDGNFYVVCTADNFAYITLNDNPRVQVGQGNSQFGFKNTFFVEISPVLGANTLFIEGTDSGNLAHLYFDVVQVQPPLLTTAQDFINELTYDPNFIDDVEDVNNDNIMVPSQAERPNITFLASSDPRLGNPANVYPDNYYDNTVSLGTYLETQSRSGQFGVPNHRADKFTFQNTACPVGTLAEFNENDKIICVQQ